MKYMPKGLFLLWLFSITHLTAQDFNYYEPLSLQGDLPKDVTIKSSEKYQNAILTIQQSTSNQDKKRQKQFHLETNFGVDELLKSGKVLFNNPITHYVTNVAKELLKENKALQEKLRFYIIRSSAVNAFSTDQGIIFITMGMLAKLKNEAELAFILAHEITHYTHKHVQQSFFRNDDIDKLKKNQNKLLKNTGFDDADFVKSMYSKDLEMEADKEGLDLIYQSNYDVESALSVLTTLKYSYLPFGDYKFQKEFLESDYLTFSNAYLNEKIDIVKGKNLSSDDKYSSHPNIGKRKRALRETIEKRAKKSRKKNVVSETDFLNIRSIARFELPFYKLQYGDYKAAIYDAYLLSKEYPNSFYIKKITAQSLYILSKQANLKDELDKDEKKETKGLEGEILSLYAYLKQLSVKDLNVLASTYIWDLYLEQPKDKELEKMAEDILVELVFNHEFALTDFEKQTNDIIAGSTDTIVEKVNKYEKILNDAIDGNTRFKYAFSNYLGTEVFQKNFAIASEKAKERQEDVAYYESAKGKARYKKWKKKKRKKGVKLGVEKVLMVDPIFMRLDIREGKEQQFYLKSETKQKAFLNQITSNAKLAKVEVKILDSGELKTSDKEIFNDIVTLKEWIGEQGNFDYLYLTPGSQQTKVDAIAEKYDANYVVLSGMLSARTSKKKIGVFAYDFFSLIMWPFAPYALYNTFKPNYECFIFFVVYDIKTGQKEIVKADWFGAKDNKGIINMHLYDAFAQLKAKP